MLDMLAHSKFYIWPAPTAKDCKSTLGFLWHLTWCTSIVCDTIVQCQVCV